MSARSDVFQEILLRMTAGLSPEDLAAYCMAEFDKEKGRILSEKEKFYSPIFKYDGEGLYPLEANLETPHVNLYIEASEWENMK